MLGNLRHKLILKKINHWTKLVAMGVSIGIMTGIVCDVLSQPYIVEVEAATIKEETILPKVARIEVVIDWNKERVEKEIRDTFPEEPNTSVAIAKAEGGLLKERQSDHYRNGVREPSFCTFQIHAPSWDKTAKKLGYGDYRTNPGSCIKMARYIYVKAGYSWTDWSVYNNGAYKKYL